VPDVLANGPQPIGELARQVGANQDLLNRVMRVPVVGGVIAEPAPETYAQTPVSDLLRRDHPESMRDLAMTLTAKSHWDPLGRLPDAVRSGKSIARVMDPAGRVLVVDMVLPDQRVPHPSYFLDITMIAQTAGGRERTRREFDALLDSSGLKLEAIHATPSPVSVVEARKA
jgi:O-methyltransferase domain